MNFALGTGIGQQGEVGVSVGINEAGSQVQVWRLDGALRLLFDILGHDDYPAFRNSHIGLEGRFPCAVYHETVLDQDV